MSWMKKILKMIKNEPFQELDNKEENIFAKNRENRNRADASKEIDAKVLYQYPKGQFQFPVIPDSDSEAKPPRQRHRQARQPQQPQAKVTPIKKDTAEAEPMSVKKSERRKKEEPAVSSKPKEIKYRKPFKPTEIPSPIYAFNRPKKSEIEYELTEFTYQGLSYGQGRSLNLSEDVLPEEFIEPEILESVQDHIEALPSSKLDNENVKINGTAPQAETNSPSHPVQDETAAALNVVATEEYLDSMQIENTTIENDRSDEATPEVIQAPEQEAPESTPTVSVSEEEISGGEKNNMERTKRNIPFNVIMLKQDKLKWEASQQRAATPSPVHKDNPAEREGEQLEAEKEDLSTGADYLEPSLTAVQPEPDQFNSVDTEPANQDFAVFQADPSTDSVQSVSENNSYQFPPLHLLNPPVEQQPHPEWLGRQEQLLNLALKNFNVNASVVNVTQGPSVTRFEVQPEPGVKVNKITNLSDDIKLSLAARDIRIEAPIPGKHTIGIEVPNKTSRPVLLSEILISKAFSEENSPLAAAMGLDISGDPIVTDLKKMPHGLIAGATGSGKSVCINTFLVSLLYKAHPDDVKLLLIDPKMVELAPYNHIPHLVSPVITDVKAATASLKWAVEEMERRYELFAHSGVRDIGRFNELALEHKHYTEKLPYIVIVIDELADLMMMSPADVEEAICRIAQKARACGIHLIIATQRPSVDVITGLIKANVPTRIAFSVSSQVDSRTIIDISGAEKLLGRGDMLFLENGSSKPVRLQGTFVTDREIDSIVAFVRSQQKPKYLFEQNELLKKAQINEDEDELFYEACEFIVDQGSASTSSVQRRFKIGYNRAARLIDMMEDHGFISEGRGSKPRDVLIGSADLEGFQETSR